MSVIFLTNKTATYNRAAPSISLGRLVAKGERNKQAKNKSPIISKLKKIPEDKSLLQLGYIDSFGLIELIEFIEKKFHIKIKGNEITLDAFGSINKISNLIFKKIK